MDEVSSEWGMNVSLTETKLMVAGVCDEEDLPITISDGFIEVVPEFR